MRAGVRAIRLVEARLVDDAARHAFGEPREVLADAQVERVVLEHARAGDQEERVTSEVRRHVSRRLRRATRRPVSLPWRRLRLHRRRDESGEQRMRARRTRLQLGMELAADEPRMIA